MSATASNLEGVFLAVRAVINRGGKLLILQRNSSHNRNPDHWEVPGGLIEIGEPLNLALKREVKEEAGLVISPQSAESLTFISPKAKPRYLELIYRCKRVRGEKVILSDEHQAFRWATVEETLDLELTPTARALMEFLLK